MVELLLFIIAVLLAALAVVVYRFDVVSSAYDAQSNLVLQQKKCIFVMAKKLGIDANIPKEYFQ